MRQSDRKLSSRARLMVRRSHLALVLMPSLWLALSGPLAAQEPTTIEDGGRFGVRSAYFETAEGVLELYALLEISLSRSAIQAIKSGVPVDLEVTLSIDRKRRFIPDESIAKLALRWRIQYHALSERYLVSNLNTSQQSSYATLETALAALRELRGVPVLDVALLQKGLPYEATMRLVAEVEGGLPDAVRWMMFWADWKRTSDWYTWTVRT